VEGFTPVPLGAAGAWASELLAVVASKTVASAQVLAMVRERPTLNLISKHTRRRVLANPLFSPLPMPFIINGETIDPALIDGEFSQIKAYFEQQANVSCCERDDEFVGYAKDNISARVLLSQAAQKELPKPEDDAVDKRIAQLVEEAGGKEAFYFNLGIPPGEEDSIREDIAASVWLERYIDKVHGEAVEPDAEAMKTYYEENISHFTAPEEVRAAHIFKSLQKVEERDQLFEELRGVRKKLLAGADFMEMAKEHSEKPTDETDLGFFKRGELMDEFE